jgi:hypothetical protein
VGYNGSDAGISNCWSTGAVSGNDFVGGLVGSNHYGSIANCYSVGNVNGLSAVGGLVGANSSSISNCYSTGVVSGSSYVGGLVGSSNGSISSCYFLITSGPNNGLSEPLTDEQMKLQDSFVEWDFIEIWNIGENQTYPYLRFYLTGDLNHNGIINFLDLAILADHWLERD